MVFVYALQDGQCSVVLRHRPYCLPQDAGCIQWCQVREVFMNEAGMPKSALDAMVVIE